MGMTTNEAVEILISVAVCDRPILSCDFCARYAGIGTHCNYPTDEEIEEAVLLLKGASKDIAISALRQQEHFRVVTKKVEPLTNAQKIRAMSDEELATFINRVVICHHLRNERNCEKCPIHPAKPCDTDGIVKWLQQPAEEDAHA